MHRSAPPIAPTIPMLGWVPFFQTPVSINNDLLHAGVLIDVQLSPTKSLLGHGVPGVDM